MNAQRHNVHFIGPFMERYEDHIRIMAQLGKPLLFIGESGTGKRLASLIVSDVLNKKGLANVNCPGKTHDLIMSELFGHQKGAFTGAIRDHKGQVEKASEDNLVLYLDEIGEMDPAARAVLLNALQEMEASPVGSDRSFPITCPIVATMSDESKSGMSEALLARFLKIYLPPLRLRYDYDGENYTIDILHLAKAIMGNEIDGLEVKIDLGITHVDRRLLEDICRLDLPRNIRDLSQFILDDVINAKHAKASRYSWRFRDPENEGNGAGTQNLIPLEEVALYIPPSLKSVNPGLSFTQDLQVGKQEIMTERKSFILEEMIGARDNRISRIILKREGRIPWDKIGMLEQDIQSANFEVVLGPLYKWLQEYKNKLCWGFSLPDILDVCELIMRYEKLYQEAKESEELEEKLLEAVGSKKYHEIKAIIREERRKGGDDCEQKISLRMKNLLETTDSIQKEACADSHNTPKPTAEGVANLREFDKKQIQKILTEEKARQKKGYKERTAQRLGMSMPTLNARIRKYNIKLF